LFAAARVVLTEMTAVGASFGADGAAVRACNWSGSSWPWRSLDCGSAEARAQRRRAGLRGRVGVQRGDRGQDYAPTGGRNTRET
jgi:hypothetical protein